MTNIVSLVYWFIDLSSHWLMYWFIGYLSGSAGDVPEQWSEHLETFSGNPFRNPGARNDVLEHRLHSRKGNQSTNKPMSIGLNWPINTLQLLLILSRFFSLWDGPFLFGMALFNRAGPQKINPKIQLRHIWPNNNNIYIFSRNIKP